MDAVGKTVLAALLVFLSVLLASYWRGRDS